MFNKLYKIFLPLLLLIISTNVHAKIFESDHIEILLDYADKESIVFFDITSTLYEPSVIMSDKRWRAFFAERTKKILADQTLAQKLSDKVEGMIVQNVPKQLVEKNTPAVVKHLQDQKIPAFGLTLKRLSTSYASNFGELTYNHLVNLGIDLQKSLAYSQISKNENSSYNFAYGIIFTNKQSLGIAVRDFLPTLDFKAKKIIVVENSLDHLKEIEGALSKDLDFVGIRYNQTDAKKSFI